jgi:hypothetical protein
MTTIAGEFGGSVPHSLSEYYRGGGLVPNTPTNAAIPTSGTISMGNFYGSANRATINLTIASNTYNYDVYANRGPTYVPGTSDITVTVNPGVVVGSTSTGAYAMLVPSSFSPGDTVRIVNNGVIQGMGGAGGNGGQAAGASNIPYPGSGGAAGGHALYVNRPTVVTNNGTLAGGGGGGGGGGGSTGINGKYTNYARGGGGGGGGAGFNGGAGGSGGGLLAPTGPEARAGNPGQTGTSPAGGAGGAGGQFPSGGVYNQAGTGGAGGGRGANGSSGQNAPTTGAQFTAPSSGAGGGAAGRYMTGNPFVTWPAFGTRQGGVS